MNKNILLYNDNLTNYNIFKKFNPILYNRKLYELYDAKIINPPFFDNIIILNKNFNEEELKMIYNMTKPGGTIFFIKNYKLFFKNSKLYKNNIYSLTKKDNLIYIFNNKYRVVDFIIMGTQKGGTTGLAYNISKHPDIYIDGNSDPFKSEIHYFDLKMSYGINWYKKHFNYNKKMVGEKTPDLMYLDYTFPYIQAINPYVKIILILRDPIERAFSSWKLIKQYFNETRTFEDAINDEIKNKLNENVTFNTGNTHYLQKGLYYKQIKNILKWFPIHNILILISEETKKDMTKEYNKVYDFLNLNYYNGHYDLQFISEDKTKIDNRIYNKLIKFYKKDTLLLEKLINKKLPWLQERR